MDNQVVPTTTNIMDALRERGYVKQTVFEEELYALLGSQSVPFYVGFDATADSLHVGHFLTLMAMSRMQKAGHKPIVLIGGGTTRVGDPTGRTDMRSMLDDKAIAHNCECFKEQMARFFSFSGPNGAVMVNNADWLLGLNYIDFLREIGPHFSVNRMLTADCFKARLEKGLSFLEFNYMLMQAYDFLTLFRKHGCKLQCGGDDQWSNALAGADLIRRKEQEPAYVMTFSLLTTSDGKKMGKTQKGAVWLDKNKTTPYELYQYFRNVEDADVERCLMLLTYVETDVVKKLCEYGGNALNTAKARLAYEVVKIVHGEKDAVLAEKQATAAFGGDESAMPTAEIPKGTVAVTDVLCALSLATSKGDAKRLIEGGGVSVDEERISTFDARLTDAQVKDGFVVHKGKKVHIKVTVK